MIDSLLEVRGVRHTALVDLDGRVIAKAGLHEANLPAELTLIAAGRAVIGSLQSNLNTGDWQELLLDVDGGPVLLTPHGNQILLTAFDDVSSLGRIRFAVRRLLGTA
ncbi:roadblock/LC7 domain-containing protein [Deinococcus taeanensis]|uniref:roadblock/LC7 domain-containing protein n=1 Tax=Deinococcus taeanensis TaxID=2737050 RepID=UPI001CDC7E43|nr:roadblock/LC7 domain-containing protein [Deinococcus taeanensis]UBV41701.1 roadblock/LC7 domain-containing protein [Deinococcus taeanensis]